MLMSMRGDELRRALAEIEAAEAHGFLHCEAVLRVERADDAGNLHLAYSDLWEKAHPTDGRLNWGRHQGVTRRHRFNGTTLVLLESTPAADAVVATGGVISE